MQQPEKVPALGRIHPLGCLYSAYTEKFFTGLNLFEGNIDDQYFDETKIGATDITFSMSNSITEKIRSLSVSGSVSLSLMAGMVELAGSASYLNCDRKSTNVSEMSLLYSLITLNQNVISVKRMKVDHTMVDIGATHVVVGIDWGAKCNISCRYENKANESEKEVNGMLEGLVTKLKTSLEVQVKGEIGFTDEDNEDYKKFIFQAKSDISKMDKIAQTFGEAIELAASLPEMVKDVNQGKGVPVNYYLLPLDIVAKACKMELQKALIVNKIESDIIQRFSQLVARTEAVKLKMATILDDILQNEEWFTHKQLHCIMQYKNKLDSVEGKFKSKFQNDLIKTRKGECNSSNLTNVINEAVNNQGIPSIESAYDKHSIMVKRTLEVIIFLNLPNIDVIGKNKSRKAVMGDQVVLYLSIGARECLEMNDHIMLFKRLAKHSLDNKESTTFQVLLTMFHRVSHSVPVVKKYKDGRMVVEDLFQQEGDLMKKCVVRVSQSALNPNVGATKERVALKIRCPKSYEKDCHMERVDWEHDKCQENITYGLVDKMMHCKCGSFKPADTTFRCDDPNHGMEFCQLNNKSKDEIDDLKVKEITNVLILGESGVGKSTWINSIAKYLAFETLDEAMASVDKSVLIPSQFSYTKSDGKTIQIMVGDDNEDHNEVMTIGESSTQKPTSYLFDIDEETQFRLIDTPGIGDRRGIKQDEINFEMILEHLSYYKNINGICILLKPNSARLGVLLKFCIGELLTHLNKSAAENILFCFTNCRGTFYQPGETLPVLQKLLASYKRSKVTIDQTNRFCFDNESFRLLACVYNGVEFSKEDIDVYSASWNRAVLETKRLFEYVHSLKPHNIDATLNLNTSRKWIIELSKPIAQIDETIKGNIDKIETKKKELEAIKDQGGSLTNTWVLEYDELKLVPLDKPRTVCKEDSCVRIDIVSHLQVFIFAN